jgi:hypothetical protein
LSDLIQIDPGLRDPDLLLLSHGADANEALVRANWPEAVKEKAGDGVEHWYLGPQEQRRAPSGGSGPLHFEIKPSPDSQP